MIMKLILMESVGKRPYSSHLLVRLLTLLAFIIVVGAALLLWQSQISHVGWVLVKVFLHLIPPLI
jgi:hypothetical protein